MDQKRASHSLVRMSILALSVVSMLSADRYHHHNSCLPRALPCDTTHSDAGTRRTLTAFPPTPGFRAARSFGLAIIGCVELATILRSRLYGLTSYEILIFVVPLHDTRAIQLHPTVALHEKS